MSAGFSGRAEAKRPPAGASQCLLPPTQSATAIKLWDGAPDQIRHPALHRADLGIDKSPAYTPRGRFRPYLFGLLLLMLLMSAHTLDQRKDHHVWLQARGLRCEARHERSIGGKSGARRWNKPASGRVKNY